MSNKSLIIIACCLVVILIIFIIFGKAFLNDNGTTDVVYDSNGNVIDTSSSQFDDMKDLFATLGIEYNSGEKSKDSKCAYDFYVSFKTPLNLENKKVYLGYINNIGAQIDFNNYRLIDKENDINITVYYDNEKLESYVINDDKNYFNTLQNKEQLKDYIKSSSVDVIVEDKLLNDFVKNDWKVPEEITEEEKKQDYIDYVQGYKLKIVDNKIFSIVYDDRFESNILSGLKSNSSYDEMKNVLGEPTFVDSERKIYGYKSNDFYMFFTGEELAIYRRDKAESKTLVEAVALLKNGNTEDNFIKHVYSNWKDYDSITEYEGLKEITYTLKGVFIQNLVPTKDKIVIYSNYEGAIYNGKTLNEISEKDIPSSITLDLSKNLIFEFEKQRVDLKNIEGII